MPKAGGRVEAAPRRSATATTFGIMFVTIVGGGVFALPIALAPLGTATAVVLVVAVGLLNMVTIAALATAITRSSASLTSEGRLASLVTNRFGGRAGVLTTAISALVVFGIVLINTLGLSGTLSDRWGGHEMLWAAFLIGVSVVLVALQRRRLLGVTSTVVAGVNIVLLLVLVTLLVPHVDADIVTAPARASLTTPAALTAVFGTLLYAFFGHSSVPTVAVAALRADPTGRSLVRGCVGAMAAATVINAGWTFVTLGSIPAPEYAAQGSTGIDILTPLLGPVGVVAALVFAALSLGWAGIIGAFVLGDIAVERLPTHRSLDVTFTRGLIVEATDGPPEPSRLALAISQAPDHSGLVVRGRRGHLSATAPITGPQWTADAISAELGARRRGRWLRIDIDPDGSTAHIESTMGVQVFSPPEPVAIDHFLDDDPSSRALVELTRRAMTADELSRKTGRTAEETAIILDDLSARGLARSDPDGTWIPYLGHRHPSRRADLAALESLYATPSTPSSAPMHSPSWLSSVAAARVTAVLPLFLALAVTVGLIAGQVSFTDTLSVLGIVALVFMGVGLSLLLAIASQHHRDSAGPRSAWVPPVPVLWTLLVVVVVICLLYATVIYTDVLGRAVAVAAIVMTGYAAFEARRHGAFATAAVLVATVGPDGSFAVRCLDGGRSVPVTAPDHLPSVGGAVIVDVPSGVTGPLIVTTRCGDGPAAALGWLQVAWPGGMLTTDAVADVAGVAVAVDRPSGSLQLTWRVV